MSSGPIYFIPDNTTKSFPNKNNSPKLSIQNSYEDSENNQPSVLNDFKKIYYE